MTGYECPVCGHNGLYEPAYSAGKGLGSYEICASCGYEYGYTDDSEGITHEQWRQRWIDADMPWRGGSEPPPVGWDPVAQLARVQPARPKEPNT
jgi:hypothetical protein